MNQTPESAECSLVGNSFANTMQFVVTVTAVSVLLFHKIFIEDNHCMFRTRIMSIFTKKPSKTPYITDSRTWRVWFMDNFKQGSSSAAAHIYATYIAHEFTKYSVGTDSCIWFLIQFLIDTIFGVAFTLIISKGTIWIVEISNAPFAKRWLTIGNYSTITPKHYYRIWAAQVGHWIVCSLIARLLCSVIIIVGINGWSELNRFFSRKWEGHRHAELFFVVLAMPIIMNSIQFLVQNWYLRWKRPPIGHTLTIPINSEEAPQSDI